MHLVRSPALLADAMKLEGAGIDLETAAQASGLGRKHLARLSEDVVGLFMKRAGEGAIAPRDLGTVFETLRPLGTEAVRVIFGRAMEKQLRKLHEAGRARRSSPGEAARRHWTAGADDSKPRWRGGSIRRAALGSPARMRGMLADCLPHLLPGSSPSPLGARRGKRDE